MGWSIGYDKTWKRDIGYGVPAICDHPDCTAEIDRGLSYVCGGDPYGGEHGCGLYFCGHHLVDHCVTADEEADDAEFVQLCARCRTEGARPFDARPDVAEWVNWKLTDESWQQWRDENPEAVASMRSGVS